VSAQAKIERAHDRRADSPSLPDPRSFAAARAAREREREEAAASPSWLSSLRGGDTGSAAKATARAAREAAVARLGGVAARARHER